MVSPIRMNESYRASRRGQRGKEKAGVLRETSLRASAQAGSRRARLEPRACAGGRGPGAGGRNHLTNQDVSATKSVFWKGGPRDMSGRRAG